MRKLFDIPDARYFFYYAVALASKERLFRRYSLRARRLGLRDKYFILSFDCDTQEDSKVVWDVHMRLADMGVRPVYVVTGKLLEKAPEVYMKIAASGAEFINHGYREHTFFDRSAGRYASCSFYHTLSQGQIEEDIRLGDRVLRSVLGITPRGFRTPHFGTFQRLRDIRSIHSVLKKLGYLFSSSTVPYYAYRCGPIFTSDGIREFPLSGMFSKPLSILDSWSCFGAAGRVMNEKDYLREAQDIAASCIRRSEPCILNFYADPSHIAGKEEFFEAVKSWKEAGRSITYSALLEESPIGRT